MTNTKRIETSRDTSHYLEERVDREELREDLDELLLLYELERLDLERLQNERTNVYSYFSRCFVPCNFMRVPLHM